MIALVSTWPEALVAIAATGAQCWLAWLAYRQAKLNGTKIDDSTVLTRAEDTTHEKRVEGVARRAEEH